MARVWMGRYSYIVGCLNDTRLFGQPGLAWINGPYETSEVRIGNFCSIAAGFKVMNGGNHPMGHVSSYPFERHAFIDLPDIHPMHGYSKGDIIIENDVWIGENVTIMSGVHIGNGAIVGTSSTVAKSMPDYAVVVGNPAETKKFRFIPEIRERLLKLKWWDWSDEKIRKALPLLNSSDIVAFLEAYECTIATD